MNRPKLLSIIGRLLLLAAGLPALGLLVYAAGIWGIPYTDAADKAILAAINPDTYFPVMDQFMRALTDYTNFLIVAPLLSYGVAFLLFGVTRRSFKGFFTVLLALWTVVLAVAAAQGGIWPNKSYASVNVLLALGILLAFGTVTYLFHCLNHRQMASLFLVGALMLLSGEICGELLTSRLKDAVARPRPFNDANKPWNEGVRPIPDELLRGRNSYPSGHTSGTFSLLAPLFWYVRDRRGRAALFTWGCLQGLSRVYTAAHFPYCVFMGGVLGFGAGTLVFFCLGGPWIRSLADPRAPESSATA